MHQPNNDEFQDSGVRADAERAVNLSQSSLPKSSLTTKREKFPGPDTERQLVKLLRSLFSDQESKRLASAKVVLGLFNENNASRVALALEMDPKNLKKTIDTSAQFRPRSATGMARMLSLVAGRTFHGRCYNDSSVRRAALDVIGELEFPSKKRVLTVVSQSDPDKAVRAYAAELAEGDISRPQERPDAETDEGPSHFFSVPEERLRVAHASAAPLDALEKAANIEIYRPSVDDIDDIITLYNECKGDLVLKTPDTREQVEKMLDQLYIAKDKETGKAAALLEIWTTANGALREERIEHYANGPDTVYFEPSVKKLYLDRSDKLAYTKRVLVAPSHRSKGISGIIRARGWQDLIYKGYEFTMGFLRFSPEPNVKSLIAHMIKAGGAIPVGIIKKEVGKQEQHFIMVHDPLERELGNLMKQLTKKKS